MDAVFPRAESLASGKRRHQIAPLAPASPSIANASHRARFARSLVRYRLPSRTQTSRPEYVVLWTSSSLALPTWAALWPYTITENCNALDELFGCGGRVDATLDEFELAAGSAIEGDVR